MATFRSASRLGLALAAASMLLTPSALADETAERGLLKLAGQFVKWGQPRFASPAEVTFAFLREPKSFPGARNCRSMLPVEAVTSGSKLDATAFEREVQAAFALWAEATSLSFREVAAADEADIVIGAQAGDTGVAFTNVFQQIDQEERLDRIGKATICLDPSEVWELGIDGNPETYNVRYVAAHEIGHAIGLDHRGRDGGLMGFAYLERIAHVDEIVLGPADRATIARLYGPRDAAAMTTLAAGPALGTVPGCAASAQALGKTAVIACGLSAGR